MMADMQRLKDVALKYQREGFEAKEPPNPTATETDAEKAYRIWGLKPKATIEEIKKRYRELATKYHPDYAQQTTPEIQELAQEKFKEIKWAFDVL